MLRVIILAPLLFIQLTQADSPERKQGLQLIGPAPVSDLLIHSRAGVDDEFCSEWNPDFSFRGGRCCGKPSWKYRRRGIKCNPARAKRSFCDEMTTDQREYVQNIQSGKIDDVLGHIEESRIFEKIQAVCSPTDGFLAFGRPLVETPGSRLRIRRPDRCVHFGTDEMVGMLEWLGKQIDLEYPRQKYRDLDLLVGDVSAPRGGCLVGMGGRRGHASHMTGQDVDLGFLYVKRKTPQNFSRVFEVKPNWWLVKKIFENPYACVSRVFLDRRHIRRLRREARGDPKWFELRPFLRHVRRHRNHFHVRIGGQAGSPGCTDDGQRQIFAVR